MTILSVKVFSNSKTQKVVKKEGDKFEIRIKEKPIDGKANQAVISALADYFKVSKSQVKIIKGIKSRNKTIEVL